MIDFTEKRGMIWTETDFYIWRFHYCRSPRIVKSKALICVISPYILNVAVALFV